MHGYTAVRRARRAMDRNERWVMLIHFASFLAVYVERGRCSLYSAACFSVRARAAEFVAASANLSPCLTALDRVRHGSHVGGEARLRQGSQVRFLTSRFDISHECLIAQYTYTRVFEYASHPTDVKLMRNFRKRLKRLPETPH